jgi:predicted Ser/Thr protein kinase
MTPQRLQQIEELYHTARECAAGEREAFLVEACGGDRELRGEVESLLVHSDREGAMDRPAVQVAANLLTSASIARLVAGAQLGPYQIVGPIGKGGMGEVYRARDTRLGRDVAIKVSAERFNSRFERESRAIAALNHPQICTLYDIGPNYLVMELVEGDTLAELLKKGALPMPHVLRYGGQIADALSAAHSKGITHRDLKPANIMIAKNGVKVLDFGLAKSASDETATLAIMGTPAYMAPEQMDGKTCDARTDIYALGLILGEMATGKKGSTETSTGHFAHLVQRCLETDPAARWQAASDIKAELEWTAKSLGATPEAGTKKHRRRTIAAISTAALLVVAAVGLDIVAPWRKAPIPSMVRFEIPVPKEALNPGSLAVSPDGHHFAFSARDPSGGPRRMWLRAVDSMEARILPGTEGAGIPFWSPDSRFVATFVTGKLTKVEIGGPPQTICECNGLGGAWSKDGVILYNDAAGHLMRVPAGGGVPEAISNGGMILSGFLPDGEHFLYKGGPGNDRMYVRSLDDKTQSPGRELATTPLDARYAPSASAGRGYLLFQREGILLAQPFDERHLKTAGDAVPLAQHIQAFGRVGFFGASANNVLVYRVSATAQDTQLTWFDR